MTESSPQDIAQEAPPQDPQQENTEGEETKPISGDVGAQLNATETNARREAMEKMRTAHMAAINEIIKELPEGSRPAQPAELQGRKLPPQALPMAIPVGETITKELLEKCIKVGLFPIPPPGVEMLDILSPEDRTELQKAREGHVQQMRQKQMEMQNSQSVRQNLMNRGVNPSAGPLPMALDVDEFPVIKGFPIPPISSWKEKTIIDWADQEHMNEVRLSLENASFIEATKFLLIGMSVWFAAVVIGGVLLRSNLTYCLSYIALTLAAFAVHVKFVVFPKASGYQCPKEFLEIPQKGKTAIVTGGASSTGGEIVKQLFRMGAEKIIVVEKSYMIGLQLLSELKKSIDAEGWDTSEWNQVVECQAFDLCEPKEVLQFCEDIVMNKIGVDYLVMNQTEFFPEKPDEDTMDPHLTTNYLGHFLMAKNLMNCRDGLIARSCRIITTGAQLYAVPDQLDLHATVLDDENDRKITTAFMASKALGILNTKMVSQRMDTAVAQKKQRQQEMGVQLPPKDDQPLAVAFNPGIVLDSTTKALFRAANPYLAPILIGFFKLVGKSPWDSAQSAFKCMFAPYELLTKGAYYNEGAYMKTYSSCNVSKPEVKMNIVKLWQMSTTMTYDSSFDKRALEQVANAAQSPSSTSSMPTSGSNQ